jgi:hypothetical protein
VSQWHLTKSTNVHFSFDFLSIRTFVYLALSTLRDAFLGERRGMDRVVDLRGGFECRDSIQPLNAV